MLGATSKPARSFNILLFAFAFTQAAELQLLPQLRMEQIYTLFMVLYLISIPLLKWVPHHGLSTLNMGSQANKDKLASTSEQPIPRYTPWMVLAAIFVSYICIGAYWTYIELANIDAGLERGYIGQVLVWASFMSIVGCLVATLISNRFGMAKPLILALLLMACAVSLMLGDISNTELFFSLLLFNFLWIFIDVYQMGSMSIFDPSGRYVSLMPAAQGAGQIAGPIMASFILEKSLGYDSVFAMCALAALCAMVIYGFTYMRLRKHAPVLANAS
jgi:predicted MFS family arabinose efflux permease